MSEQKMSVPDAMWASIELNQAEHRVAEAALNIDYLYSANNQEWTIPFGKDFEEFHLAVCDLRKLKGEG